MVVLTRRAVPAAGHPRLRVAARCTTCSRCAFARAAAVGRRGDRRGRARACRGEVIDPTGRFCLRDVCPAVIGDVLVYRNTGHITATYAATLAPWLERRLS